MRKEYDFSKAIKNPFIKKKNVMKEDLSQGIQFLFNNGYNLFSVTKTGSLPQNYLDILTAQNIDVAEFPSLITIGSGGRRLWEVLDNEARDPFHPVNCFTEKVVGEFIKNYLNASETITLFPKESPYFSVQTFAHWLGWAHPTPLGKNIHKEFGVWHAYRSIFLTTLMLPETLRQTFDSPCVKCEDKPCVKSCPSGAVSEITESLATFNKKTCLPFRLEEGSPCKDLCISRLACPYAKDQKYLMEQIKYHYSHALRCIKERYSEYHPKKLVV